MVLETEPFNIPKCTKCDWQGDGLSPSDPGKIQNIPGKCPNPDCDGEIKIIFRVSGGPEFRHPWKKY
jgi:hypothetical protein